MSYQNLLKPEKNIPDTETFLIQERSFIKQPKGIITKSNSNSFEMLELSQLLEI